MVLSAGGDTRVRTFPGLVEASRRVELAFQVPGLLVSFPVKEGQRVAKGDVIGQLRTDELDARLKTLQGQLDQSRANLRALQMGERLEENLRRESQVRAAEARLANARTEYQRYARLLPQRVVPRADYDRAQTTYRVAQEELKAARQLLEKGSIGREESIEAQEAEVRALEGRVVEANLQLADTTLHAPYDGVIAQRFVEENQTLQVGQPVVKFQDVDEVIIACDVPESVMTNDIRSADIVQMVAELSGAPGREFAVTIREIAQVADPATQTFKVRVAMQVPPGVQVLPGMTASVTVVYRRSGILGDTLLVPISAIHSDTSGKQIAWVVQPNQSVASRPCNWGRRQAVRLKSWKGLHREIASPLPVCRSSAKA
jgi:multidrug efflux pump subunit AcrA (membrane-fusion protein)